MLDMVIWANGMNTGLILKLVADIPAEKMCDIAKGLPNHPAWQIGHLTFCRASLAECLGQPGPVPSKDFARFAPGSTPEPDPAKNPSKEDLLHQFNLAQAHLEKILPTITTETLEKINPIEGARARLPQIKHLAVLLTGVHDGWHIGQLCDFRRLNGLPKVL